VREQSEKQREKASKTLAGIKRSQKDEGKSKKHSTLLAKIISYIVEHDDQNAALPNVLELLEHGVPANVIISFCIIIHPQALEIVLGEFGYANTFPKVTARQEPIVFDAEALTTDEKNYINLWLEMVFVIITQEVSSLMTRRFLNQLHGTDRDIIIRSLQQFLSLFFVSLRIEPTAALQAYAKFILEQMERKIRQTDLEDIDTGGRVKW
jgi:hypothetical protein